MDTPTILAYRYAQAFLNLFTITGQDLIRVKEAVVFLEQHKEMFSLLKVPLLDARIKEQALDDYLISRFKLPVSFKKIIELLVVQKRSYLMIEVLHQIAGLYEERQGIEAFTISSSAPLEKNDLEKIYTFLADQTHHTITCDAIQDKRLIGGIRMQSEQHLWEYSIKKQLARIRAQLSE